jgi:hypothetical protein
MRLCRMGLRRMRVRRLRRRLLCVHQRLHRLRLRPKLSSFLSYRRLARLSSGSGIGQSAQRDLNFVSAMAAAVAAEARTVLSILAGICASALLRSAARKPKVYPRRLCSP